MNNQRYDFKAIRDKADHAPIDIFDMLTDYEPNAMTDRGWPRPRNSAGYPVPWVSPQDQLKMLEPSRRWAAVMGRLCQVCGEGHQDNDQIFMCVNDKPPANMSGKVAFAMSDAMLHYRCAKLSLGRCPGLGGLRREGELWVAVVKARHVYLLPDDTDSTENDMGTPRVAVDGDHIQTICTADEFMDGVKELPV